MDAWSPEGYRHFCLALSVSFLLCEFVKSVVDLVPGLMVNFAVYNAWGFVCLNACVLVGKHVASRKSMWFLNGFVTSAVLLLAYSAAFTEEHWVYCVIYGLEFAFTMVVANHVRTYESPDKFIELANMRGRIGH
jgi:hypothetical protein